MTTPVGWDTAGVEPPTFVAVTTTRTVSSTSPSPSVYVDLVAPGTPAHPLLAQSCHWYVKLVGLFPQVPRDAVSVLPSMALPLIVGSETLTGDCGGGGGGGGGGGPPAGGIGGVPGGVGLDGGTGFGVTGVGPRLGFLAFTQR
jgi:hypothetical protein